MINDYLDVENAEGMPALADATFALDFLLSIKTGIQNNVLALAEAIRPEVRKALLNQLNSAVALHGELTELMLAQGWLHPHDLSKQAELDLKSAQMAQQIAGLDLFPGNTSRLGTFATPFK
ncbi:MAG TPA: spore coat protein [Desulfosporosinus sp.]|nr:spore coat protein [Desulfosporosinus sp.]